tara:strand:- start:4331 stop:4573 length:243 start_codon:yes stop_codon:yes gene_type:complete
MSRSRNNNVAYAIEVDTPNGDFKRIDNIINLERVAKTINKEFFNGFSVVSRPMVNNWLYYPDTPRRNFATNFNIIKYEIV